MENKATRKPRGYWTLNSTLAEAKKVVEEKGYLPSDWGLRKIKRNDLAQAIYSNGGFYKIRELLGLKNSRKPDRYWNLGNTLIEAKQIVEELGYLPSSRELIKINKDYITSPIMNNGGFHKIRELLNLEEKKKPIGYWTKKNILTESRKVVNEYGYLPDDHRLREIGKSDLARAISKNYGFSKIREILGLKGRKFPGFFSNMTKEQWLAYGKESSLDKLSRSELQKEKVRYYKKGLKEGWLNDLGVNAKIKSRKYWTLENILKGARKMIEKKGYLPSEKQLVKIGKGDLGSAIRKKIGFKKIRELLGFKGNDSMKQVLDNMLNDYTGER